MEDKKPTQQETQRNLPSLDSLIAKRIRMGLERYALRYDPEAPADSGVNQLSLPFDGVARALSGAIFPVNACEVLREFFPDGGIRHMPGLLKSPDGNLVLAQPTWLENALGRIPIICVRAEHLDDKEHLDPIGRFGVLREVARLLMLWACDKGMTKSFNPTEVTEEVQGGEFLDPAFFQDPLNRWAMELGCPPAELSQLLREEWGHTPVTYADILKQRPMLEGEDNLCDIVFMEMRYRGKGLDDIFGFTRSAIIGWCRFLKLTTWHEGGSNG